MNGRRPDLQDLANERRAHNRAALFSIVGGCLGAWLLMVLLLASFAAAVRWAMS